MRFDATLDRAAVDVEEHYVRFKWVDVGDTLIALEPSVDLGAEEKLVVRYQEVFRVHRAGQRRWACPQVREFEARCRRAQPRISGDCRLALALEIGTSSRCQLRAINGP
ncbi:DUF2381 family protein [Cystobacter fuscus]|nr:DUF2381 family protein [Cystobacter fuscus]